MANREDEKTARIEGELKEVKLEEAEVEQMEQRLHNREEHLEHELEEAKKHAYEIFVNRDRFEEERRYITGHEILALVNEDDGKHGVAILRGGEEHDEPVGLDQRVDIAEHKNRRFKTFPDKSTEGR
jgi:hypothetical protein